MTHIHQITSEHRYFLRQERQDPITGDTICEGDEVVFCGACKSVFLKDSWEYLGGKHCGQETTLDFIPSLDKGLRLKERILFKKTLQHGLLGGRTPRIREAFFTDKSKPVSSLSNFFFGKKSRIFEILMIPFTLAMIAGTFLGGSILSPLSSFLFSFGFAVPTIGKAVHDSKFKRQMKQTQIEKDFFYVSRKGIGCASKYGHDYLIPIENIDKIVIKNRDRFDFATICTVHYGGKYKAKFTVESVVTASELENLVRNLQVLTNQKNIPIELKFKDQYKKALIKRLLSEHRQTDSSILLIE